MANSKRKTKGSNGEGKPGFYYFPKDWDGSEISRCGPAAQGLWINLLNKMWFQNPRGVLPSDREALGDIMAPGGMAELWWEVWGAHLAELERKHVFSRGSEFGLADEDAIVNRRMYREWCKEQSVSEARRFAVSCRKDRQPAKREGVQKCTNGTSRSTNGLQNEPPEMPPNIGDTKISGGAKSTKINRSRFDSTEPMVVGELVSPNPRKKDEIGKELYERILEVTGDKGEWAVWWNRVVCCFLRIRRVDVLEDLVTYVEKYTDGRIRDGEGEGQIHAPGPFLTTRVLKAARRLRDEDADPKIPTNPKRRVAQ